MLLDSGANELIRPYNHDQWGATVHGMEGSMVRMYLAGNIVVSGAMTKFGEVMMQTGRHNDYDIAWIIPVCRLQSELGYDVLYKRDNSCILISPEGNTIIIEPNRGLTFAKHLSVQGIAKGSSQNHLRGRKPFEYK